MTKVIRIDVAALFTVFGFYNISDAKTDKPVKEVVEEIKAVDNRDVSIFSLTLGKSLNDLDIKECKIKGEKKYEHLGPPTTYEKLQENICWKDYFSSRPDFQSNIVFLGVDSAAGIFSCGKCISLQVRYLEKGKQAEPRRISLW